MSGMARTQTAGVSLGRKPSEEELALYRRTQVPESCPPELVEDAVRMLAHFVERTGLDPVLRQCWLNHRQGKITVQATIDGFRIVAGRSGEYEGQTPTQWCGPDGAWRDAWLDDKPPAAARAGVYRKGFREPIYAVARYAEYVQTREGGVPNVMWRKMPANQLGKCAEALALRKAFPEYLSGMYTVDEMAQAENDAEPDAAAHAPAAKAPAQPPAAQDGADAPAPRTAARAEAAAPEATAPKTEAQAEAPAPAAPPAGEARIAPHRTAQSEVSRILDPVREAAKKCGVPMSDLGRLFVERFGHTTREATVEEAMAFARLALRAPTDDGARFIEFLRSAPSGEAA